MKFLLQRSWSIATAFLAGCSLIVPATVLGAPFFSKILLAQTTPGYTVSMPITRSLTFSNTVLSETTGGRAITSTAPDELSMKPLFLRTTITDGLGCARLIEGGDVRLFLHRLQASNCLDNCIRASLKQGTCSLVTTTPREELCRNGEKKIDVECQFKLPYFAEPTDIPGREDDAWLIDLEAEDSRGQYITDRLSFAVASLKALTVTGVTDFGMSRLGSISEPVDITLQNSGNVPISAIQIQGFPFTCKNGSIPNTLQRFSFSRDTPFDQMTPLPDDHPTLAIVSMDKSTFQMTSTRHVFWRVKFPDKGLSGACAGKIRYLVI